MITILVADDGPGIAPELRERVFDQGFSTRPAGSGLGLALSRALAWQLGGRLTLRDSDVGATFALALPRWVDEAGASA
jgi:two-component system CitB family sensor kinase